MRYRMLIPFLIILMVISIGTVGFRNTEHLPWFDSLYLTIMTITTVGYGDVTPHTHAGKAVASMIAILGIGTILSSIPLIIMPLFEGSMRRMIGGMELARMKNHVIICGYTPLSEKIMKLLQEKRTPFIVLEPDENKLVELRAHGIPVLGGDPSDEYLLEKAAVRQARSLLVTMGNDADDVFVTMTARNMRKELKIIAEASQEKNIAKLKLAGANVVISPEEFVGKMFAEEALSK
ncbi:NAD-binding protein [Candidatus Micrarchaeota archaeon]|nr:NAD-binding protein [Candidatus Micrarchaeota archaeon]